MIGLGGWGGEGQKNRVPIFILTMPGQVDPRDPETMAGVAATGPQHEFVVEVRNKNHPRTKGMPPKWLHMLKDELYDSLHEGLQKMWEFSQLHTVRESKRP